MADERLQTIYFMRALSGGPVKIGITEDVYRRRSQIQSSSPAGRIMVLATLPGTRMDERELHWLFGHLRLHGEWFEGTPELLGFINGIRFGLHHMKDKGL